MGFWTKRGRRVFFSSCLISGFFIYEVYGFASGEVIYRLLVISGELWFKDFSRAKLIYGVVRNKIVI